MKRIFLLSLLGLLLWQCKKESIAVEKPTIEIPKQEMQNTIALPDSLPEIKDTLQKPNVQKNTAIKTPKNTKEIFDGQRYSVWPYKGNDSLIRKFNKEFSAQQKYIIAALNRIDVNHIKNKDSLIVPREFHTDFLQYSPFPKEMKILEGVEKFIVFSYPIQAFAVYENGLLIKWGPTNMGKKSSQTPRQLYFTNWKSKKIRSTVDSEWILHWNFNIHNTQGVGFHQYALPGYPASHSCLRLLSEDAKWLYNWADQWVLKDQNTVDVKGTPVLVYGNYNFGKKGIWHQLYKNPNITDVLESELTEVIQPHIETILKEQQKRKDYFSTNKTTQEAEETVETLE